MCGISVCSKCHEKKEKVNNEEEQHVCKQENLDTAKLLAQDTKPCPSCATPIFKISGCDQMFCTKCHTGFSWKTGKIEKGVIHNPHYYELQRLNGGNLQRNIGDVPCGGLPHPRDLEEKLAKIPVAQKKSIMEFRRTHDHNQEEVLPRYRVNATNDNRDVRIKYMVNEIGKRAELLELHSARFLNRRWHHRTLETELCRLPDPQLRTGNGPHLTGKPHLADDHGSGVRCPVQVAGGDGGSDPQIHRRLRQPHDRGEPRLAGPRPRKKYR